MVATGKRRELEIEAAAARERRRQSSVDVLLEEKGKLGTGRERKEETHGISLPIKYLVLSSMIQYPVMIP
jgi:hypothetical protein